MIKKTKKAIIFGAGTLGELVDFYLENDSSYEVVAFCSSTPDAETFCGKPLIAFSNIEEFFPPEEHHMFVAVGYRGMNDLRKTFCNEARGKGYTLLSYISSKATFWDKGNKIGDNVFIFEDNTIQPFVEIGDGVILWSGNHIGHHTKVGAYTFITSHVVISGFCTVGEQVFMGVNATLVNNISIGSKVLIGAAALVTESLEDGKVIVGTKGTIAGKSSDSFLR